MVNQIIFEDSQILVANKPAGLPIQNDKTGDLSLMGLLQKEKKSELFMINRIDRPASGIVLFAKNKTTAGILTELLRSGKMEKTYLAVVAKKPEKPEARVIHYIRKEGKSNRSFAFDKPLHHTKEGILEYTWLAAIDRYHLLKILLITGRHHQIRAQLSAMDNPVKGDVKYGFRRGNRDRSIHLHSWKLRFQHPETSKSILLEAPLPEESVWQAFSF